MGFSKEKAEIEKALEDISGVVRHIGPSAEKAQFLEGICSGLDRFSKAIRSHKDSVERETLTGFLKRHNKYNGYLYLDRASFGLWSISYFSIPLCEVYVSRKSAVFFSMDSMKEEIDLIVSCMQDEIQQKKRQIRGIRRISGTPPLLLFLVRKIMSGKPPVSQIKRFRSHIHGIADETEHQIDRNAAIVASVIKNKDSFLETVNKISHYLYMGLQEEGYALRLNDIKKGIYDFRSPILDHPFRWEYRKSGLFIHPAGIAEDVLAKETKFIDREG